MIDTPGRTRSDGWVSLEVSPSLVHDTARSIDQAEDLHRRAMVDNLFIKIPGTAEGLPPPLHPVAERSVLAAPVFLAGAGRTATVSHAATTRRDDRALM